MYSCVTRMSFVCHSYVLVCHLHATSMCSHYYMHVLECHPYVTRMYIIRMSLVCTRMSLVWTRMYSYVIRVSLVCHPYVFLCHSYVVVCHPYVFGCHPYVTSMWFYREPGRYKVKDLNDVNIVSYIARKVLLLFHLLELFFIFYLNSRNVSTVSKW